MKQSSIAIAKLYNFVPKIKTEEELNRIEINANVELIAKNGEINILYNPPVAAVPTDWKDYFVEEELLKLDFFERQERIEQAKEFMHVTFVKNSEEYEQTYFLFNLTQFTEKGIHIQLNFSDPLFIS